MQDAKNGELPIEDCLRIARRFAYRHRHYLIDPEDIVQEVMIRILNGADRRCIPRMCSYVAVDLCRKLHPNVNRHKYVMQISIDDETKYIHTKKTEQFDFTEITINEMFSLLEKYLSERHAYIFSMKMVGLTHEAIGQRLGYSAYSRISQMWNEIIEFLDRVFVKENSIEDYFIAKKTKTKIVKVNDKMWIAKFKFGQWRENRTFDNYPESVEWLKEKTKSSYSRFIEKLIKKNRVKCGGKKPLEVRR